MPRRPRPLAAGAVYHVTARGNRHAPIFLDDADRARFVRALARTADRLGWSCLAWCLMTTHYHLLVLTPEPNLSAGMHRLNGDHAQYFNVRHGLDGHVFQGRFHSESVLTDSHLLSTVRYVAMNPVKAGLASDPLAWPWSSHRALLGLEEAIALDRDAALARFAADGGDGRRRYAEFLDRPLPPTPEASAPPVCAPARPLTDAVRAPDDAESIAAAYLDEGYSTAEIASALGVGETTVRRRLRTSSRYVAGVRPPPLRTAGG